MALSEAAIKRNKKRRNSANSETMTLSELELERRLQEEHDKFDPAKKEKRTSKRKNLLGWTGLRANTLPKKDKVDKKSKKITTSKKTSGGTGLRANTSPKIKETTKYKMVTAPHRNPTNKKIRVVDRPGKPRKKIMVNPARGFKGGGKIYSVDNSGQNLVQKMYGGKIQN